MILQGLSIGFDILWRPWKPTKNNFLVKMKVSVYSWGLGIWVSSTSFQKKWPQQPPTEKVLKFNMIFPDSVKKQFQNKVILVLRLLNSRTWMTLKTSVVIFKPLETFLASLTSAASATSKALFPQKTSWPWSCDHHW